MFCILLLFSDDIEPLLELLFISVHKRSCLRLVWMAMANQNALQQTYKKLVVKLMIGGDSKN